MQPRGGRCSWQGRPKTKVRDGLTMRVAVRMRRVWCAEVHRAASSDEAQSSRGERKRSHARGPGEDKRRPHQGGRKSWMGRGQSRVICV